MKLIWYANGSMHRCGTLIRTRRSGRSIELSKEFVVYTSSSFPVFVLATFETIVLHSMYSYIKSLK